jgi:hypothetical protein
MIIKLKNQRSGPKGAVEPVKKIKYLVSVGDRAEANNYPCPLH